MNLSEDQLLGEFHRVEMPMANWKDGIMHIRRMAGMHQQAQKERKNQSNYRTFQAVNKDLISGGHELNKHWRYHKQVIDNLLATSHKTVLESKIGINAAPVEHLRLMGLPSDVLTRIIEHRVHSPFRRKADLLQVYGIGKKYQKEIPKYIEDLPLDVNDSLDGGPVCTSPPLPTPTPTQRNSITKFYGLNSSSSSEPHHTMPVLFRNPDEPCPVLLSLSKPMAVGKLWADSGCARGVGEEKKHVEWSAYVQTLGLEPLIVPCNEQFNLETDTLNRHTRSTVIHVSYKDVIG